MSGSSRASSVMPKLNPTQRMVLRQAIADGGEVVLSGADQHAGWNRRHRTAARQLDNLKLGKYWPAAGYEPATFRIHDAGYRALEASR